MYDQHIIVDFEMNPVAKKYSEVRKQLHREIIEIGATKVDSAGKVIDTFNCFVKPEFNSEVANYITRLTGIRTADVYQAASFSEAIQNFTEWIGPGKIRIYSWSNSDLIQLKTECNFKKISFPANMLRWVDFQILFPRLMEIKQYKSQMSLHEAAEWYGIFFDQKSAHRALYDARVTTELVTPVLTGEYLVQRECLKKIVCRNEIEEKKFGLNLGDLCREFFNPFIISDTMESWGVCPALNR